MPVIIECHIGVILALDHANQTRTNKAVYLLIKVANEAATSPSAGLNLTKYDINIIFRIIFPIEAKRVVKADILGFSCASKRILYNDEKVNSIIVKVNKIEVALRANAYSSGT